MNLLGISINHQTSPIELREALHFSKDEIVDFIPKLKEKLFSEGIIISTCNRTEIFGIIKDEKYNYKDVQQILGEFKPIEGFSPEIFQNYFSCSAVRHLFTVASGINSLVLGDSQILGQVKEAFEILNDLNFSSTLMHRLYEASMRVGKRSIHETMIGEGAVTVSFASVKVIEKIFSDFESKSALIVGAGETGDLAAVHLKDKGIGKLFITNRTKEKAIKLAEKINGEALDFGTFKDRLQQFDIIISATSAENYILNFDDIKSMMKKRKGDVCCIMDIAIPRDVDPKVKKIDGVFYNDIDSLNIIVDQNKKKREKEVPVIKKIIIQEMIAFFSWYNTLNIVPTIKEFRDFFEEIRRDEFEKIKHKLQPEELEKVENMTKRLIGRILHNPTTKIKKVSESKNNFEEATKYSAILRELFDLKENNKEENFEK